MRITHRTLLILVGLLFYQLGWSQHSKTFSVLHYAHEQGLLGQSTYGITQDYNGFVWIGTDAGLVRFDGLQFSPYTNNHQIASRVIERIFPIGQDSFFIVGSFPFKTYRVTQGICEELFEKLPSSAGTHYHLAPDNSISAWQRNQLHVLHKNTSRLVFKLQHFPEETFSYVHHFSTDSFFVASTHNAWFFGQNDTTDFNELQQTSFLLKAGDSTLFFNRQKVWVYKNQQLRPCLTFSDNPPAIVHGIVDKRANIWVAGKNQKLYLISNGHITEMSSMLDLDGEQVTHLFLDNAGNVWISTESSGIRIILASSFTNYSMLDGLTSNNVTSLAVANNLVYIGTSLGVHAVYNNQILNGTTLWKQLNECESYKNAFAEYIHGLSIYDQQLVLAIGKSYTDNQCNSMVRTASAVAIVNDTLITGSWGTLACRYLPQPDSLIKMVRNPETPFRKEHVILARKNGSILIGTPEGLFQTTTSLKSIRLFEPTAHLVHYAFRDLFETSDGNLWCATDKGLLRIRPNQSIHQYTTSQGLISNNLTSLAADSLNRIWIGSSKGLNVLDNNGISYFTKGSGLIHDAVSSLAYQNTTDVLWIGTKKGLSQLNLSQLKAVSARSFPIYTQQIEVVGDTSFSSGVLPNLSWKQNHIKLHFGARQYVQPDEIVYQYRLLPIDSQWQITQRNTIEFQALAPNSYTFQVRSKASGTTWGSVSSTPFSIQLPYWQNASFLVFFIFALLGLVFLFFYLRIRALKNRERKKADMLKRINHLEQQALSLSMNPHFIFNSLNSIQQYFSHVNNRAANDFIARFSALIRLNMDSAKKRFIPLNEELKRLDLYLHLEKERFDKAFAFTIDVDPELKFQNPEIPNMVIQPLVENAIWHGILPGDQPGELVISILPEDEGILITIIDNGVGLGQAAQNKRKNHHSKGLSITEERLKHLSPNNYLHLKEQFDGRGKSIGTKATIYIVLN